jgi:multiple sugar transport system substrate-binding protein
MTRRTLHWQDVIAIAFAAVLTLLTGCASGPGSSPTPSSFSWKQFQGTTLRVLLRESHWATVIGPYLSEFEALTGITLEVAVHPQDELWAILDTRLAAPGQVDVFSTIPGLDGRRYLRAGQVLPLNAFLQDARLTAPDYQWEDFLPRYRATMEIDGQILGPPVMVENLALLYRKDVLAQHGLTVPRTLDEFEAAARLLHMKPMGPQGLQGVGFVSRGKNPVNTSLYAGLLHAYGGTWLDGDRRPAVAAPASLQALEFLARVAGRYAPPNLSGLGWEEASTFFMEGRAAMYIDGSSVFRLLETSDKSRVIGKVGYALFPAGPAGSGATVAALGLAVARQSANPQAAWLFLQWASSKAMVRRALMNGILVGRHSTWQSRWDRTEVPVDLVQITQEAGRIGNPHWAPPMVAVTPAREAVGAAVAAALRGEDFRAAAQLAERQLAAIQAAEAAGPRGPRTP